MKTQILTKTKLHHLFDHILDGFKSSQQGADYLLSVHIITPEQYADIIKQNADRLITRIEEFKIIYKITSLIFAVLFTMMQINGDDIDMRKPTRTSRSMSRKGGRRKSELSIDECYHQWS